MASHDQLESRLQSLIEVNRLLVGTLEPEALLKGILESVMRLFSAEGCSIALIDEAAGELLFTTILGRVSLDELRLELGSGIAGWVAATGEPVISNDVSQDRRFYAGVDQQSGFKTRSILCVPLRQRDRVIGALEAINTAAPDGFTNEDLELLDAFAGLAATALERSRAVARIQNANAALQEDADERYGLVAGESRGMQEVVETARTAAAARSTVLLLGESGVGKEVLARSIHRWSPRASGPFVAVNCVALTPELLESELFGHERGAFTGAVAQKKGKFELADGGTIFLDEIGDLAGNLQAKLLRVLQEREFQRVGGTKDVRCDVRVIAATNRDLHAAIRDGSFREDLYYRLNVVSVTIPPLRERSEELATLVDFFLERYRRETNRPPLRLSDAALELLRRYRWPGNVRELENAIERAVVLSSEDLLEERMFPPEIREGAPGPRGERSASGASGSSGDGDGEIDAALALGDAVDLFKQARIRQALDATGGNQTRAAEQLGMRQSNLSRLMRSLGMK
jgi:Nif-specific regulatory protein